MRKLMLALCLVKYVMVSSILMCPCTLVVVKGVVDVLFLVHPAHVVEVVIDVAFLVHLAHVVKVVVVGVVLRELSMIASVEPRHSSHKARYIYVEVVGVRKLQLEHFP
jgi:hypothetical protein